MANVHQSCKRDGWSKSKVACEQNHKIAEFYLILWSPVLFLCHDLTEPHNVTFPHSLIFYLWHMILGTLYTSAKSPPLPTHTHKKMALSFDFLSGRLLESWSYSSLQVNHFLLSRSANSMTFGILNTIYVYNPIAALKHYCTSSWTRKCIKRLLGTEIQHLRNRVSRHIDKMSCNTEPC